MAKILVSLDSFTKSKDLGWSGMCAGTDLIGFEVSPCWRGGREDEVRTELMVETKDLL